MTQSGSDDEAGGREFPGDWEECVTDESDDVYCRWQSKELSSVIEVSNVADSAIVVEVKQDVAVDGYISDVVSHLSMSDGLDDAIDRAVDFMAGATEGKYSVEALCAFESDEVVDFVCVYTDDLEAIKDLDVLREIIQVQLGDLDPDEASFDESEKDDAEASAVAIDIFPKTKNEVEQVSGDGV